MNDDELKPCPFCGTVPTLPKPEDVLGTWFEWECSCDMVSFSNQIYSYMTLEERVSVRTTKFFDKNMRYPDEYILRVVDDFKKAWNTRYVR